MVTIIAREYNGTRVRYVPCIQHNVYSGADKSLARPGRKQATFPAFYELESSLPHLQEPTTCPYPSQINPILCPSYFWQAQLVSFLVGLRTYQKPNKYQEKNYLLRLSFHTTWRITSITYRSLTRRQFTWFLVQTLIVGTWNIWILRISSLGIYILWK